jgi:hypothetical protein
MSYLYQQIMNVPGLTGTWQQRNAQYYKALGSPMGKYTGSLQQNLYLLDQIKKQNFPQVQAPAPQPAQQPVQPQQTLAGQYAAPGVEAGQNVSAQDQFETVMPFYDAWGRIVPQASAAAASQINPELMRQYEQQARNYAHGMVSAGGQRMGRGLAGLGELKAESERNRQAQMQDWLNQYQQGYREIFYDPSRDAWNKAITQGKTPDSSLTTVPTWDEVYQKYNNLYGVQGASTAAPVAGQVEGTQKATPGATGNPFETVQNQMPSLPSLDPSRYSEAIEQWNLNNPKSEQQLQSPGTNYSPLYGGRDIFNPYLIQNRYGSRAPGAQNPLPFRTWYSDQYSQPTNQQPTGAFSQPWIPGNNI